MMAPSMNYQIGDEVAFDIPIGTEGKQHWAEPEQQRFGLGVIKAVLEQEQSYQITALMGRTYTVREGAISGRARIEQAVRFRKSESH
jgi:hypothetical protein